MDSIMRSFRTSQLLVIAFICQFWSITLCDFVRGNELRFCHDGPDPISHWIFSKNNLDGNRLKARLGPDGMFTQTPKIQEEPLGETAIFSGRMMECVLATDFSTARSYLPSQEITVEAWVGIDQPIAWGGIIGVFQDNGNYEKGWLLGYDETTFYFGLATAGADDRDGRMTYLKAKSKYESGKLYHVVGIYDGELMQIYVNGQLEGESQEQSGAILYPVSAPYVIGAYHDENEFNPMRGRLREISVFNLAARKKWVRERFEKLQELTQQKFEAPQTNLKFLVKPFLQYGTQTGMTVVWESSEPTQGTLYWGEDISCPNQLESESEETIHQIRIEGLKPDTQYFYYVDSQRSSEIISSEPSTFQTACPPGQPIAFAVISDTQKNLKVAGKIASLAWAQRPHFVIHPGDLVDRGTRKSDWLDEFFPSMDSLISRVPMYSVLGNHEEDAGHYYEYMALPEPEYFYSFAYGDAEFFMIDSNRRVDADSEQYQWLDRVLAESKATWKFACHHHPPFSSDEDDYGDLWKTNKSTQGDLRVRELVTLYEKHGVDIVWTGHIHSYERTWPVFGKRTVEVGGTVYMVTGGGGGSLETPGPYRPFFQNVVRRGHHYVMVHINGRTLEMKAFDLNDRMFDSMKIEKRK
jgi:3',5'-cyclic AMP phosphodiesterase CpdA